jgi:hypothetical protein
MTTDANKTDETPETRKPKKAGTSVSTDGKQKMSEKDLKAMGLDPAVYGYVKK